MAFGDSEFITVLYLYFLGRQPDESGMMSYLGSLRRGEPKIAIIRNIVSSDEAKGRPVQLPGLDKAVARFQKRNGSAINRWRYRRDPETGRSPIMRAARILANRIDRAELHFSAELAMFRAELHTLELKSARAEVAGPAETDLARGASLHRIRRRPFAEIRPFDLPGSLDAAIARLKI